MAERQKPVITKLKAIRDYIQYVYTLPLLNYIDTTHHTSVANFASGGDVESRATAQALSSVFKCHVTSIDLKISDKLHGKWKYKKNGCFLRFITGDMCSTNLLMGPLGRNPLFIMRHPEFTHKYKVSSCFAVAFLLPFILRNKGKAYVSCHTGTEVNICAFLLHKLRSQRKIDLRIIQNENKPEAIKHPMTVHGFNTTSKREVTVPHDMYILHITVNSVLSNPDLTSQLLFLMDFIDNKIEESPIKFNDDDRRVILRYVQNHEMFVSPKSAGKASSANRGARASYAKP